jgi:hypothetical protein
MAGFPARPVQTLRLRRLVGEAKPKKEGMTRKDAKAQRRGGTNGGSWLVDGVEL